MLERLRAFSRLDRVAEVIRFYQAAAVNTAFGYGCYALLVWLGLNPFAAQAGAQVAGTMFNYFTYSRHVFRDHQGSLWRFAAVYLLHYGFSVALLAGFTRLTDNPYIAGLGTLVVASVVNFIVLKFAVFTRRAQR